MKLLDLKFIPQSSDLGLLLLRVFAGFSLIYAHGWKKLVNFSGTVKQWTEYGLDPLGIGARTSVSLVMLAEVVCALLLIVGLRARFAALVIGVSMAVAFFFVHKGALTGENSGEMAFLYLISSLVIVFAGSGKLSVDGGR